MKHHPYPPVACEEPVDSSTRSRNRRALSFLQVFRRLTIYYAYAIIVLVHYTDPRESLLMNDRKILRQAAGVYALLMSYVTLVALALMPAVIAVAVLVTSSTGAFNSLSTTDKAMTYTALCSVTFVFMFVLIPLWLMLNGRWERRHAAAATN